MTEIQSTFFEVSVRMTIYSVDGYANWPDVFSAQEPTSNSSPTHHLLPRNAADFPDFLDF